MKNIFHTYNKKVYPIIFPVKYGQMNSINCYLYEDGDKLTLIDAGVDLPEYEWFFLKKLNEYGFCIENIDQIILTHHHADHIGMVNKLLTKKQLPIFAHSAAIERLTLTPQYQQAKIDFFSTLYRRYGCETLLQSRMEKMKQTFVNDDGLRINTAVQPLKPQSVIDDLLVLETPGHSLDSISLYDEQTGWLFSGDCVIEKGGTNALIDFDERKLLLPTVLQQRQSLESYLSLGVSTVFAGHESIFNNLHEVVQQNLSKIEYKAIRIAKQVAQGNNTALAIAHALYGKLMHEMPTLIFSEVIGYLYYAEILGLIKRIEHKGQLKFQATHVTNR